MDCKHPEEQEEWNKEENEIDLEEELEKYNENRRIGWRTEVGKIAYGQELEQESEQKQEIE